MLNVFLAGIVIFLTHTLEAITGFGCTVLAVPFITALFGMREGIMIVTVIAWILALYIVITKHRDVVWKQAGTIIALMLPTLPVGMFLFRNADQTLFKTILALFIIAVSAYKLTATILHADKRQPEFGTLPLSRKALAYGALLAGGIVHGAFSSGGPLVVLYATKALTDKRQFRATLCVVWSVLNTIIIASYVAPSSYYSVATFRLTCTQLPFLAAGIVAGEYIHDKVHARTFSIVVFSLLLATGIFMVLL